jgi:hypothetical protein
MNPDLESSEHDFEAQQQIELPARLSPLYDEMFEKLAPAVEGPILRTGHSHHGRLVFGDADAAD